MQATKHPARRRLATKSVPPRNWVAEAAAVVQQLEAATVLQLGTWPCRNSFLELGESDRDGDLLVSRGLMVPRRPLCHCLFELMIVGSRGRRSCQRGTSWIPLVGSHSKRYGSQGGGSFQDSHCAAGSAGWTGSACRKSDPPPNNCYQQHATR